MKLEDVLASGKLRWFLLAGYGYVFLIFSLHYEWVSSIYFWLLLFFALHCVNNFKHFFLKERFGFWLVFFEHDKGPLHQFLRYWVLTMDALYLLVLPAILANLDQIEQ